MNCVWFVKQTLQTSWNSFVKGQRSIAFPSSLAHKLRCSSRFCIAVIWSCCLMSGRYYSWQALRYYTETVLMQMQQSSSTFMSYVNLYLLSRTLPKYFTLWWCQRFLNHFSRLEEHFTNIKPPWIKNPRTCEKRAATSSCWHTWSFSVSLSFRFSVWRTCWISPSALSFSRQSVFFEALFCLIFQCYHSLQDISVIPFLDVVVCITDTVFQFELIVHPSEHLKLFLILTLLKPQPLFLPLLFIQLSFCFL